MGDKRLRLQWTNWPLDSLQRRIPSLVILDVIDAGQWTA